MRKLFSLMTFAACLAVTGFVTAAPASAQTVGIATSNPGSLFHNIGTAVANAANKAGVKATIQPATSPNHSPFQIRSATGQHRRDGGVSGGGKGRGQGL